MQRFGAAEDPKIHSKHCSDKDMMNLGLEKQSGTVKEFSEFSRFCKILREMVGTFVISLKDFQNRKAEEN
jgi:hypothetical protein